MNLINFSNNILYRYDLIIKYLYVKNYLKNYKTDYFINLYKNHIILFNNAKELDNNKNNIDDFINCFNNLIEDIKKNGFNENYKIPYNNNLITNGAHRFSICYYLNIEPKFVLSIPMNQRYDYYFFNKRNNKNNIISVQTLENCILECIKINKNLKCMLFFPQFYKDNNLFNKCLNLIENNSKIIFKKSITLNKNGLSNLIKELYRGEEWIGGLFPNGINPGGKFNYVVNNNKEIQELYLIILKNDNIINLKKQIRKIYNNHHCVHTTDYFEDTFRTASSLLNENSLFFLNNSNISNLSNNSKKLLKEYFNIMSNKNNSDEFCITSSIVLELFGLRKANDIDYLNTNNIAISTNNQISCHKDKWLNYYNYNKDEIIFNPQHHFYFNGLKICTIQIVKEMKENRKENKDINDIKLISKIKNI